MTTSSKLDASSGGGDLLAAVQRLVEAERTLTQTLTTASQYLPTRTNPLLLPTPRTMEEVTTVLAVARTYADRTSAPSGWNPLVPIHGFVTPNPLPHHLRGGQLAALQLKEAQEERERKRQAAREEREKKTKQEQDASEERKRKDSNSAKDVKMEDADDDTGEEGDDGKKKPADPKRRELDVMHEREDMVEQQVKREARRESGYSNALDEATARQQQAERERAARNATASAAARSNRREVPATMNLSGSSSSEEEDEDDDDVSE